MTEEREKIKELEKQIMDLKKKRKKGNIILGVIGSIFLGSLGSGAWERVVSPITNKVFEVGNEILSGISTKFSDNRYAEIAKGYHENYSLTFFTIFIFMCICVAAFLLGVKSQCQKEKSEEKFDNVIVEKTVGIMDKIMVVVFRIINSWVFQQVAIILLSVIGAYILGEQTYVNTTIYETLNNIEIVSPYIEDKEYKQLKSDFHLIQNEGDYKELVNKITSISKEYDLALLSDEIK